MKFTFDGITYNIRFRYPNDRHTVCTVTPNGAHPDSDEVYFGHALRRPSDEYDKEVARKVSLENAIALETRPFRTAAWAAYFGRKGAKN